MKTVNIKPAVAYVNGKRMIATQLNVVSISDNLFDCVIFKYTLLDASDQWAGESTFSLNGLAEYSTWSSTPDGAFQIVANAIQLEIIFPMVGSKVEFVEVA